MRKRYKILIHVFLLAALITSCSIKKRVYRKGFFVDWREKVVKHGNKGTGEIMVVEKINSPDQNSPAEPVFADHRNEDVFKSMWGRKKINLKDSCGDIIYLKNGDEINARIVGKSSDVVKYYSCRDDSFFVISTTELFMIKNGNGSKEVYKSQKQREINPFVYPPFWSLLLFFIVMPCVGGVFSGIIALIQIWTEPGKYTGKMLAIIGIISNIVLATSFVLLLIALIS